MMNLESKLHSLRQRRGFTLIFASLIGSLVFSIGIAILDIAIKQHILTDAGRATQQSFYSADSGIDCALYLDRGAGDQNCTSGYFGIASSSAHLVTVCDEDYDPTSPVAYAGESCFGVVPTVHIERHDDRVVSTFSIDTSQNASVDPALDICFDVTVVKRVVSSTEVTSVIESRGYNTCRTDGPRYERAVRAYNY